MNTKSAINFLEEQITDARKGLPEEIFLFASSITPLVNVELLIKDENGRTLLSWRDDKYAGKGWHIPGGIVRFKESLEERIQKVAKEEIGTQIEFEPNPIAIKQVILEQNTRGHSLAFMYKCFLNSKYTLENKGLTEKDAGYLKWHEFCPNNLIKVQEIYREFINDYK
ncbi:MAG: NUDIX domain-containing protein [Candidatus Nanoarchaeia archaeon]|nr:NUDIX domain-containing protein [Candidatus Nanoarchaeia archaeon]MDD5358109.1 NUDIX domain-containing protein [Candidatus Nanoarchaeia archaeon]MDD5589296.1 NUDIX domain-containing protein [Candidatus Nanoarchaeia archaeon]